VFLLFLFICVLTCIVCVHTKLCTTHYGTQAGLPLTLVSLNFSVTVSGPWKYLKITPVIESPEEESLSLIFLGCCRTFLPDLKSYSCGYTDVASICSISCVFPAGFLAVS